MRRSDSFQAGALLTFSGGLQDAYTYNVRGAVFANAQTGNVVLMSQNLMSGEYARALYFLCPLLAFALGVFLAERIESRRGTGALHWRHWILLAEIAVLTAVGFLPVRMNMAANMLVSFSCAMQLQAFRSVDGFRYASTMCIGNLRSGTESLSLYFRSGDRSALRKALYFFGIILCFAVGAGVGGVLSGVFGIRTIWLSPVILFAVLLMLRKRTEAD